MELEEKHDENYYASIMLKTVLVLGVIIILFLILTLISRVCYINPVIISVARTVITFLISLEIVVVIYCGIRAMIKAW